MGVPHIANAKASHDTAGHTTDEQQGDGASRMAARAEQNAVFRQTGPGHGHVSESGGAGFWRESS